MDRPMMRDFGVGDCGAWRCGALLDAFAFGG
jgi:hypothetical protein